MGCNQFLCPTRRARGDHVVSLRWHPTWRYSPLGAHCPTDEGPAASHRGQGIADHRPHPRAPGHSYPQASVYLLSDPDKGWRRAGPGKAGQGSHCPRLQPCRDGGGAGGDEPARGDHGHISHRSGSPAQDRVLRRPGGIHSHLRCTDSALSSTGPRGPHHPSYGRGRGHPL